MNNKENSSLIMGYHLKNKTLEKSSTYEIGENYLIIVPINFRNTLLINEEDIIEKSNYAYIVYANFETPVIGRSVFHRAFESGRYEFPLTIFYWDKHKRLNLRKSYRFFQTDIYAIVFENFDKVANFRQENK